MRKILLVIFACASMQLGFAEVENDKDVIIEDVTEISVNAVNVVYEVDGPTSYALNGSTSGVGSSYSIAPLPPANATFSWKLQGGGRGYIYPNQYNCGINLYDAGSYRLSCIITINGVKTESATYITVTP